MRKDLLDYISDEKIRKQCKNDYKELSICLRYKANKASIVLIGSLMEAILYEYITSNAGIRKQIPNFEKRKLTLNDLLQYARKFGILEEDLFRLSEPIRDYRNYIHPNVYTRKELDINENIVQIGISVFLELVGRIKNRVVNESDVQAKRLVRKIVKKQFSREATKSDIFVYLPIIKKYGEEKGSKIITESIKNT